MSTEIVRYFSEIFHRIISIDWREIDEYAHLSKEHLAEKLNYYKINYGVGTHNDKYFITFGRWEFFNIKKYKQRRSRYDWIVRIKRKYERSRY